MKGTVNADGNGKAIDALLYWHVDTGSWCVTIFWICLHSRCKKGERMQHVTQTFSPEQALKYAPPERTPKINITQHQIRFHEI